MNSNITISTKLFNTLGISIKDRKILKLLQTPVNVSQFSYNVKGWFNLKLPY